MPEKRSLINWAFVPLFALIAVRAWVQEGPVYAFTVIAGGLLFGLLLRRRGIR